MFHKIFIVFCVVKNCVYLYIYDLFHILLSLCFTCRTNERTHICIHVNLIYHLLLDLPIRVFLHDETHTPVSVSGVSPFISRVRGVYFCGRLFACFSLCKDTLSNSNFVRSVDGQQRIGKPRYPCVR